MKKIFLTSLPALILLAACSSDNEPVNPNSSDDHRIDFYATAPKSSRAASTTTASLQSFVVYAFTNSAVIMNGVTVSRDGGSWTYSPAVYWPADPVDFYALSPDIRQKSTASPDNYNIIRGIEYGSTDQLYAVSLDRIESPAPVPLTFRHAMSRVSIMLSSTSNRYAIEVYHVSLNNIALSGDFSLPEKNTDETDALGTWSNLSAPGAALVYYDLEGGTTLLSPTPRDLTEGNLNVSFFVPQPLTPLAYSSAEGFTGSYMEIDCVVKDKLTGTKIWPNEHTPSYLLVQHSESGKMLFPLSTKSVTSWQQGYSYIYNVEINTTYSIDTIEFAPSVTNYIVSQPF